MTPYSHAIHSHSARPRVTQDSSDGAEASVNGGVGDGDAGVAFP